jgi:hypothetical protein
MLLGVLELLVPVLLVGAQGDGAGEVGHGLGVAPEVRPHDAAVVEGLADALGQVGRHLRARRGVLAQHRGKQGLGALQVAPAHEVVALATPRVAVAVLEGHGDVFLPRENHPREVVHQARAHRVEHAEAVDARRVAALVRRPDAHRRLRRGVLVGLIEEHLAILPVRHLKLQPRVRLADATDVRAGVRLGAKLPVAHRHGARAGAVDLLDALAVLVGQHRAGDHHAAALRQQPDAGVEAVRDAVGEVGRNLRRRLNVLRHARRRRDAAHGHRVAHLGRVEHRRPRHRKRRRARAPAARAERRRRDESCREPLCRLHRLRTHRFVSSNGPSIPPALPALRAIDAVCVGLSLRCRRRGSGCVRDP